MQRAGTPSPAVERLLNEEQKLGVDRADFYRDFAVRVRSIQTTLKALLESLKRGGQRIAGYAVSAKGAILLNSSGIDGRLIDYVVDRSPYKQGKAMPGVHLRVYDPARLLEAPAPDYLLLLAWNFKDEIMEQQEEYRKRGGKFIVPIPVPAIVADARV